MREAHLALACNLKAVGAAHRPRYNELVGRLRSAIQERTELQDGYCYSLRSNEITPREVAEWITMERLCCPFLVFQLEAKGEAVQLTLSGPAGAKEILREEFPEHSK